jgi:Mg2+/citrate symporter
MTRTAHEYVAKFYRRAIMPIIRSMKSRYGASPNEMERGDVPGWVMITLMTAVIVVLIWGIASTQLTDLLNSAFGKVSKQGG